MNQRPDEHPSAIDLDRARWELLSAYIDGELTSSERLQVEQWLHHDLCFQQAYREITRIQEGFSKLPFPPSESSYSSSGIEMDEKVLSALQRDPLSAFVSPKVARRFAKIAAGLALIVGGGAFWQLKPIQSPQMASSIPEPAVESQSDLFLDVSAETFPSDLMSTDKARLYLLSPSNSEDAYSILLTDG